MKQKKKDTAHDRKALGITVHKRRQQQEQQKKMEERKKKGDDLICVSWRGFSFNEDFRNFLSSLLG